MRERDRSVVPAPEQVTPSVWDTNDAFAAMKISEEEKGPPVGEVGVRLLGLV